MAMSAFKSTTKRVCGIDVGNDPETPSKSTTQFNSPIYRRTRSFSDFSSRHHSDILSAAGSANSRYFDALFRQRRAPGRYSSEDSESDAETVDSHHSYRRRQNADLGAFRKTALLEGTKAKGPTTHSNIRRSSSSVEGSYQEIQNFLSCIENYSDQENGTDRPYYRHHRADSQSDSKSLSARLTRQISQQEPRRLVPARAGNTCGTRASSLRRVAARTSLPGSLARSGNDHNETESSNSRHTCRSREDQNDAETSYRWSRPAHRSGQRTGSPSVVRRQNRSTGQAALRHSSSPNEGSVPFCVGGFSHAPQHESDSEFEAAKVFRGINLDLLPGGDDTNSSHPVEEKTIRAVHTWNKDPEAKELDAISFYDAMRLEMRKVVSEFKNEIEQQKTVSRDLDLTSACFSGSRELSVPGGDEDEASIVSKVGQEYAAKLEQFEKRAQGLLTQLAAGERRCQDLVKFVKKLLASQNCYDSNTGTLELRPTTDFQVDKEHISECLDADAQRYFNECVSISGLDIVGNTNASSCGGGYKENESPAQSVKDMIFGPRTKDCGRSNEKVTMLQLLTTFCAHTKQDGRCISQPSNVSGNSAINDDGLILPWLRWETCLDLSFQGLLPLKDAPVVGDDTASSTCSHVSGNRSQSSTLQISLHQFQDDGEHQCSVVPPGVSFMAGLDHTTLSPQKESLDVGNVHVEDLGQREWDKGPFDMEIFVLRTLLSSRINCGRILICGGTRS